MTESQQQQIEMFSLVEMEMLYEKAKRHFSATGQMVPIQFIYRNKSSEYFQEIRANSLHNGGDQIMKAHAKNGSGHPQCPIVVGQLKGLYFGTFVLGNGIPPANSHFGEHRIAICADYLLQPQRYSLFFADFYCARYASDVHYIVLVLAENGSKQERFCQAHLIKLDMRNNPFLYCAQQANERKIRCFVARNGSDQIYLFHAADFNISKCLAAQKCIFSRVELIRKGIRDNKLAVGHTYDDRCAVCGIRGENENSNTADNAQFASTSSGTGSARPTTNARGWRLWHFDCSDLPSNCPRCEEGIDLNNISKRSAICVICAQIDHLHREKGPAGLVVGSKEEWAAYLKETKHIFPDADVLDRAGSLPMKLFPILKWPNEMAKSVRINKKVGIALFRDGIVPDCDNSTCRGGGYFYMCLHTTAGNNFQLAKINRIFVSFVSLALHGLPVPLGSEVSGIFVRANIPHGKPVDQYNDLGDLPCKFIFEFWIRDKGRKSMFWPALSNWTAEQNRSHRMALEQFKFMK